MQLIQIFHKYKYWMRRFNKRCKPVIFFAVHEYETLISFHFLSFTLPVSHESTVWREKFASVVSSSASSTTTKDNKERKCWLILKRKQEYPFLGTNRSFTKYSQNKCFIYLNNKEPQNNCAHPEVRKQMATPNTFSSKPMAQSVYKSIIYTYGGKLKDISY